MLSPTLSAQIRMKKPEEPEFNSTGSTPFPPSSREKWTVEGYLPLALASTPRLRRDIDSVSSPPRLAANFNRS